MDSGQSQTDLVGFRLFMQKGFTMTRFICKVVLCLDAVYEKKNGDDSKYIFHGRCFKMNVGFARGHDGLLLQLRE